MSTDGQGTKCRRNIADNLNRLSRVHECYRRQTTDGRAIACSEREREFTFAKKWRHSPNCRLTSIVAKRLDGLKCHLVWRLASAQATLC